METTKVNWLARNKMGLIIAGIAAAVVTTGVCIYRRMKKNKCCKAEQQSTEQK